MRLTQNVATENWKITFVAHIRPSGKDIFVFKNQSPNVSANNINNKHITIWIIIADENTILSSFWLFLPNSNVIKREIDIDMAPDTRANIETSPPTTL